MKSSLPILAATLLCLTSARAAQVNFKDIASTNVVKTNDLLLVDSALGGTNYATRTAPIARVVGFGVVTNALSMDGDTNKFVNGKGLLTPIYGTVTNYTITGGQNIGVTTTVSGTNVTTTIGTTNIGTLSELTVGAMAVNRGTLTHAGGNVIVDFASTNRYWSCIITGNVTFVLTNAAVGKWANLLLFQTQATNCTPTFNLPAGTTNWFGGAPSTLTANTVGALSYYAISSDTNATKAIYVETQ